MAEDTNKRATGINTKEIVCKENLFRIGVMAIIHQHLMCYKALGLFLNF